MEGVRLGGSIIFKFSNCHIFKLNYGREKRYYIQQNQINIELSEEIAEGIYSNLAMIAHSNSEFVIDFIKLMPGVPKARVKARVIVTPEHAKRLLSRH
jgi:hypothetical protein